MIVIDPLLPEIVLISFIVFLLSFFLAFMRIPSVIAYIVAGVVIGPQVLGIVQDSSLLHLLGNLGVILLLFFIGLEMSIKDLLENWKISLGGTLLQVCLSVTVMYGLSLLFNWPLIRVLLFGFVITLSSTAIVLKTLETYGETGTRVGKSVLGILIVQDILAIPMIIILSLFGQQSFEPFTFSLQIVGMILATLLVVYVIKKKEVHLPFMKFIKKDTEMQIFVSLGICFGFAYLSSLFGLSSALGAFVAGILVSASKEMKEMTAHLSPFYVVFVSIFFLSIGLLVDLAFIREHIVLILILTGIAYVLNITVNVLSLKLVGLTFFEAIYSALLLSHIGEFSYVLAAIGLSGSMISTFGYDIVISVISVSMLISPILIGIYRVSCKTCVMHK